MLRISPQRMASRRGFTLIELMVVVVILGILAAVAVVGFTKYIRSARKSQVVSDLSAITLRQKTFMAVTGHYASSTVAETDVYPSKTDLSTPGKTPVQWDIGNVAYTRKGVADGANYRGGGAVHGFDALRFLPEGAKSHCGYGTISGWGTNAVTPSDDEPGADPIAEAVFPTSAEAARFFANDWYYSFAICDLDFDSKYWALTTAHYTSDVSAGSLGTTYTENE
jgi:prepilin-type N-terminal cleavage/methylation domain-containing protein